ncbi:MAG: hypothetical protein LBI06_01495 [Treponema sp.]|nr:hypothetical protein [Treponema sp.]
MKTVVKTTNTNRSIGVVLMNVAVAAYLFATGIIGFAEKSLKDLISAGEIRKAVTDLFGRGDLTEALIVIFSILTIAAAVFILLKLFGLVIPMSDLILIILAVAWLAFIVIIDIVNPLGSNRKPQFVDWLRVFGSHLMVLAGMILATERFSRK